MTKEKNAKKRVLIVALCFYIPLSVFFLLFFMYPKIILFNRSCIDPQPSRLLQTDIASEYFEYAGRRYRFKKHVSNILIMGIDKMESVDDMEVIDQQDGGQADFLMMAMIDDKEKSIRFITINRNFLTSIDMYDENGDYLGRYDAQINVAHGFGDGKEVSCIREAEATSRLLYGIPINGYAAVNIGAISALTDLIGGVELDISDWGDTLDERFPESGKLTLDGNLAYLYTRYRDKKVVDSSTDRLNRQRQFFSAWTNKAFNEIKEDPTTIFMIINTAFDYIVTDLNASEIVYLTSLIMTYDIDFENVETLPGEVGIRDNYEVYTPIEPDYTDKILSLFFEEVSD